MTVAFDRPVLKIFCGGMKYFPQRVFLRLDAHSLKTCRTVSSHGENVKAFKESLRNDNMNHHHDHWDYDNHQIHHYQDDDDSSGVFRIVQFHFII